MIQQSRVEFASMTELQLALGRLLASLEKGVETLGVIVSDSLCKSMAEPRFRGATSKTEIEMALRMRFAKAFGEDESRWRLCFHLSLFGSHDLVCGLPESVVTAIGDCAKAADLRVSSIRPFWVVCAEETEFQRRRLYRWLLVGDDEASSLALFQGPRCLGIRTSNKGARHLTAQQLIAREGLLFEGAELAETAVVWGKGWKTETDKSAGIAIERAFLPEVWVGRGGTLDAGERA
ncbi:MAG: hypothetical protein IPL70_15510 [Uliginosibacterium sp.]|nr:hypothetical protein [Uliginosibacterium sp.]